MAYEASDASLPGLVSKTLIPSWTSTPIPNLSLSAGGLLALADLNTIAQRTAITGGSSWLDALVLAPGLHYQQAADALDQESAPGLSAELGLTAAIESMGEGQEERHYTIHNIAMVNFLKRLWQYEQQDGTVTLNVGLAKEKEEVERLIKRLANIMRSQGASAADITESDIHLDWISHVLYLCSPVLTVAASTFMILLGDWWGLAFIVALMVSRLLNIWIIKQRSQQSNKPPLPPLPVDNRATEYTIDLGANRRVVLRGRNSDLQAVTTQVWLRSKSSLDGYLEAIAKLIVYLVAAFSGNLTQAGAMVLMSLLLLSAGLLGLSNAHIRGLQMHGRIARPELVGSFLKPERVSSDNDNESGRREGLPVEDIRGR